MVFRVIRFPHSLAPNIIHIPLWAFFLAEVNGSYVNLALGKNFTCYFFDYEHGKLMEGKSGASDRSY